MSKAKPRNNSLYDRWSLVHIISGIGFGLVMDPMLGLVVMAAWEPFENFVLSPVLAHYGIDFGYESLRNALSDIFFDAVGISIGYLILRVI